MSQLWSDDEDSTDDTVTEVESEVVNQTEVTTTDDGDDMPQAPNNVNSLVKPVDDIDEVVDIYEQFEMIKSKLLDKEADITKISSGSYHINKSGWRKIATAFNLSVDTAEVISKREDGVIKYVVKGRAVAPNGKSCTATGMCASNESNFMRKLINEDAKIESAKEQATNPDNVLLVDGYYRELKEPRAVNEHNIMATAETRARNRTISDLVGGGEVSAEEMANMKREDILEE